MARYAVLDYGITQVREARETGHTEIHITKTAARELNQRHLTLSHRFSADRHRDGIAQSMELVRLQQGPTAQMVNEKS